LILFFIFSKIFLEGLLEIITLIYLLYSKISPSNVFYF